MILHDLKKEKISETLCKISAKLDNKELYYIVSSEYEKFLSETYDSFLLAILFYAMYNNQSIHIDGSVSEKLHHNITQTLVPMLHFCYPTLHSIQIKAKELVSKYLENKEVGLALSCGIDSLSCLQDHYFNRKKITIACNFHSGGSDTLDQYRQRCEHVQKFIQEKTDLSFIGVESNMDDFKLPGFTHEKNHAIKTISFVHLFPTLFKRFYIASGLTFNEYILQVNPITFGWIEGFVIPMLSTESTEICLHGSNYTRLYKTYMISKNNLLDHWIDVCIETKRSSRYTNCGGCFKCARTLLTLECYTHLDRYKKTFDLENYRKNRNSYIKHLDVKKHALDGQLIQLLKRSKRI